MLHIFLLSTLRKASRKFLPQIIKPLVTKPSFSYNLFFLGLSQFSRTGRELPVMGRVGFEPTHSLRTDLQSAATLQLRRLPLLILDVRSSYFNRRFHLYNLTQLPRQEIHLRYESIVCPLILTIVDFSR